MATRGTGIAYEREVKKWLEEKPETLLVIRSAGSHGPFDLVAIGRDGDVRLIQCKARYSTDRDMEEGYALALKFPGYVVEYWHRCSKTHEVHRYRENMAQVRFYRRGGQG